MSNPYKSQEKHRSGFVSQILLLVVLGLASVFFLASQKKLSVFSDPQALTTPQSVPSPAQSKTYTNQAYSYEFSYRLDPLGYVHNLDTLTDDFVEINGLDFLVIRIEPIEGNYPTPLAWWESQEKETYSGKGKECFEQSMETTIQSLYEPEKKVITFSEPVLVLDNLQDANDTSPCTEPPGVRLLVAQHKGKLIKITYTWSVSSEEILSSFRFIP